MFAELEMRDRQIDELEAKAAVHASELTHAHLERDWAKDEQRRAEEALAKSRTRNVGAPEEPCIPKNLGVQCGGHGTMCLQVNGQSYTHEEACWELEKLMAQVKVLVATNEAYSAAERSENDVWQIALKDMSAQLQVTSSERAACQTAMLKMQEYVASTCTLKDCELEQLSTWRMDLDDIYEGLSTALETLACVTCLAVVKKLSNAGTFVQLNRIADKDTF